MEREKVHVSMVTYYSALLESLASLLTVTDAAPSDVLGAMVHTVRAAGDLQNVRSGTGEECYVMMKREIESCGCQH